MPTKEEIYQQIADFNKKSSDPNDLNGISKQDKYFFVDTAIAKVRGEFFNFLLKDSELKANIPKNWKVIDLAFGSGSLTSHLILEADLNPDKIAFNDKNLDEINIDVEAIPNAEIFDFDFLDASKFPKEKFNLVVFNPHVGSTGDNRFKSGLESIDSKYIVNFDGSLEAYLTSESKDTSELKFAINEKNRVIEVTSDKLTNPKILEVLDPIRVFNYYEVRYKSGSSEKWKNKFDYKTVLFRATFDKVFDPKGILAFYGDENIFKTLFSDFNYVSQLCPDSGKILFVATKAISDNKTILYKKAGNNYTEVDSCKEVGVAAEEGDLDEFEREIEEISNEFFQSSADSLTDLVKKPGVIIEPKESYLISDEPLGSLNFPYKNVLLKGVPGTGKSRLIDEWIKNRLGLVNKNHDNVLRINIHSASSNADLMQGIGITSNGGQVEYHEKTGLLMNHLKLACQYPKQPFAIVLEEIQENSLNELIGDLIYLIEEGKRVDLIDYVGKEFESFEAFVNQISEAKSDLEYVRVPYLVKTETKFRKLIFPANLFVFCTSNYRDDKKVVEDNLMRRFDLIEMYPEYTEALFFDNEVKDFLEKLNFGILAEFAAKEIHPDRLIIGHANWLKDKVTDEISFCRALLKAIVEFKDIREIEWSEIKPVLDDISKLPFGLNVNLISQTNYKELIVALQEKAFGDHLNG